MDDFLFARKYTNHPVPYLEELYGVKTYSRGFEGNSTRFPYLDTVFPYHLWWYTWVENDTMLLQDENKTLRDENQLLRVDSTPTHVEIFDDRHFLLGQEPDKNLYKIKVNSHLPVYKVREGIWEVRINHSEYWYTLPIIGEYVKYF